jgi:hypothetical protein
MFRDQVQIVADGFGVVDEDLADAAVVDTAVARHPTAQLEWMPHHWDVGRPRPGQAAT